MIDINFEGAGFFLIHPTTNLLLTLVDNSGFYDLPKGVKEENESPLSAAKRECFEECSILIEESEMMDCGPFFDGRLILFCAETVKQPAIIRNQKSGIIEHLGYKWVNPNDFLNNCRPFLKPIVRKIFKELSKRAHPLTNGYI
jgi:8-oxo-dGTP pyrophosphatase MutT (NUDIX family)